MSWKNLKYSSKGAIIGFFVPLIILTIFFIGFLPQSWQVQEYFNSPLYTERNNLYSWIFENNIMECSKVVDMEGCTIFEFLINPIHWIFYIIMSLPTLFIGWLMGKFKDKQNKEIKK